MNPRLVALSGPFKGAVFPITKAVLTVGRAADNDVCLDDELASKHHFSAGTLDDGRLLVTDGDTTNGLWVNEIARIEAILAGGEQIKCGSTTFLFLRADEDPAALPTIIEDETDRSRSLVTLRADYAVREETTVYYKAVSKVFAKMPGLLNSVLDPVELQKQLLDLTFEVIPALRGAILLNGRCAGPDSSDFVSRIFRQRGYDGHAPFALSGLVLEDVYAHAQSCLTNNISPVICAPLIISGRVRGVIYLEGAQSNLRFEPEHGYYLRGIADFAVMALRLARQVESIRDERDLLKAEHACGFEIIGQSPAMQGVLKRADQAASCDAAVLITGETGTGKELIARRVHQGSSRAAKQYVVIDCGAMVDGLVESELFGHTKGAFTGAMQARKGKLRQADGGTAVFDEIGELPIQVQPKLLRALQGQTFKPVGQDEDVTVNVRVIASTNVDLEEAVLEKRFRQDLFYRLNVIAIRMPPLRERREDIPLLIDHFVRKYDSRRCVAGIAPEAMEALLAYGWPGNIRELQNAVQSAVVYGSGTIGLEHLPECVRQPRPPHAEGRSKAQHVARKAQRGLLEGRLETNGRNVAEAAEWIGITRQWAYRLLAD